CPTEFCSACRPVGGALSEPLTVRDSLFACLRASRLRETAETSNSSISYSMTSSRRPRIRDSGIQRFKRMTDSRLVMSDEGFRGLGAVGATPIRVRCVVLDEPAVDEPAV